MSNAEILQLIQTISDKQDKHEERIDVRMSRFESKLDAVVSNQDQGKGAAANQGKFWGFIMGVLGAVVAATLQGFIQVKK